MRALAPEDRMAFYLSIERVAPQVWADLRAISAKPRTAQGVTREDVAAFLGRWGLDPACKWLGDDVYVHARGAFTEGIPATGDGIPTHGEVLRLSWEPGDSGEDRAAFVKRAHAAIDAYAEHIEAWRRTRGINLPRRQRERGEVETGPARWDLLVSRIVLGQTYDSIAREFGITPQGARKHVEALAARLGLSLKVRQPKQSA